MIPHRMLSSELFASGMKVRVTACRKRLRVNRPARKEYPVHHAQTEFEAVFPELSLPLTDILDDHPAGMNSIRMECSPSFVENGNGGKMARAAEEQEAGIT